MDEREGRNDDTIPNLTFGSEDIPFRPPKTGINLTQSFLVAPPQKCLCQPRPWFLDHHLAWDLGFSVQLELKQSQQLPISSSRSQTVKDLNKSSSMA